jgi:hypothetical protein
MRLWRKGIRPTEPVSIDTETSGLFTDDGARVSTVSVGWLDPRHEWADVFPFGTHQQDNGVMTYRQEEIRPDWYEPVASIAWPFDQGVANTGKREDTGQMVMWPDADNLPESEWEELLDWLDRVGSTVGLDMHNAKFDILLMEAGVRRWPGMGIDLSMYVRVDTQNAVALLYPTLTKIVTKEGPRPIYSLKPTSQSLWGEAETDEQQVIKRYLAKMKLPSGRWDLMPWDIIGKYADQDARLTTRLAARALQDMEDGLVGDWFQEGKKAHLSAPEALARRLEVTKMLHRIERRGLPFAIEEAQEWSKEIKKRAALHKAELPFSPATGPAGVKYWFGKPEDGGLGIPPVETTASGAPSLTDFVVEKLAKDGYPGAEDWRQLKKLQTADERWYEGWSSMTGSDGRLRGSIRQNGTVSFRFSIERVQLQAIPHDYKLSGFSSLSGIPTPRVLIGRGVPQGYKLWELDLQQAELRVAALYANCTPMLDLIYAGEDLHGVTASELFEVTPDDPKWGQMRNVAKRANFSLIFGVGSSKLQADIEKQTGVILTDKESQALVRDWNALYPQFGRAIDQHSNIVKRRMQSKDYGRGIGWIDTVNGERRWFLDGEDTHKAFNQRVQPNLAQYGLDMWLAAERLLMDVYGDDPVVEDGQYVGRIGMVMMIHDSMVLLLPDDDEAVSLVDDIKAHSANMWAERFPGMPGGLDAKHWKSD